MSKKTKNRESGVADGYIHGFTKGEQDRLFEQARVHEDAIFSTIDFSNCQTIVEIGSGVGAQTKILLERYPDAKIQCADASAAQVARATQALREFVKSDRVKIDVADALHLPTRKILLKVHLYAGYSSMCRIRWKFSLRLSEY